MFLTFISKYAHKNGLQMISDNKKTKKPCDFHPPSIEQYSKKGQYLELIKTTLHEDSSDYQLHSFY